MSAAEEISRDRYVGAFQGVRNADLKKVVSAQRAGLGITALAPEHGPLLRHILASRLFIDDAYQRKVNLPWVRRVAANFDPDKFDVLKVCDRGGDCYAVIDGQQRLAAIDLMGYIDQKLPCLVYVGLTPQQEAELFVAQDDRLTISAHDMHRAAVLAGRTDAVEIQRALDASGYVLDSTDHGPNAIRAIGSVYRVYRKSGADALEAVLKIIATAWRGNEWQPNAVAMQGTRAFIARHHEFDVDRLVAVLTDIPPSDFIDLARRQMSVIGGSTDSAGARILTKSYNRGLRSNRLGDWDSPLQEAE
jgi:hypothetical protein